MEEALNDLLEERDAQSAERTTFGLPGITFAIADLHELINTELDALERTSASSAEFAERKGGEKTEHGY